MVALPVKERWDDEAAGTTLKPVRSCFEALMFPSDFFERPTLLQGNFFIN
jgi:hypothetical protein